MTCSEFDDPRRGFTLFELLVAIGIVLLLAGLTLGAIRASRTHQSLEQTAARLRMLVEVAGATARSGGGPVYLAVADLGAVPETDARRAFTLIRDLDDPVLLRDWERLPRGVVFAPDEAGGGLDLMRDPPVAELSDPFGPEAVGGVSGPVRVLLRVDPDGRFRAGEALEPVAASLTIRRGRWLEDAVGGAAFVAEWEEEENADRDFVRLRFRPLTGVVVAEGVTL